jgi:hypothetical protein
MNFRRPRDQHTGNSIDATVLFEQETTWASHAGLIFIRVVLGSGVACKVLHLVRARFSGGIGP